MCRPAATGRARMARAELPSFHGIIGRSEPMQALFRRIEAFAHRNVSILIQGETGTGKDLVASTVQKLSTRRDRPYEVVNCATLTRELLPSELFGHERGAFTGAVARKQGLLAVADGGTVFLGEVGELPLDCQGMLLRLGRVETRGLDEDNEERRRMITATNRNWSRQWSAVNSARTSITASATSSSRYRRSGLGAKISRSSSSTSWISTTEELALS